MIMAIQWGVWNPHISKTCSFASIKIQLVSGTELRWTKACGCMMFVEGAITLRLHYHHLVSVMSNSWGIWLLHFLRRYQKHMPSPGHLVLTTSKKPKKCVGYWYNCWVGLKQPRRKNPGLSPKTLSLASMITYYVAGSHTSTVVNMGVTVHGMTHCKELVETLHKIGASISYADTLLAYDYWALMGVKASATCPPDIADWKACHFDCGQRLQGRYSVRQGNMSSSDKRYVRAARKLWKEKPNEEPPTKIAKRDISAQLKRACHVLTQVGQYRCPPGSKI